MLVVREQPWPLPPLPQNVTEDVETPAARVIVSERVAERVFVDHGDDLPTVVLHPSCLVVGMGCNKGTESSRCVNSSLRLWRITAWLSVR